MVSQRRLENACVWMRQACLVRWTFEERKRSGGGRSTAVDGDGGGGSRWRSELVASRY